MCLSLDSGEQRLWTGCADPSLGGSSRVGQHRPLDSTPLPQQDDPSCSQVQGAQKEMHLPAFVHTGVTPWPMGLEQKPAQAVGCAQALPAGEGGTQGGRNGGGGACPP